MPTSIQDAIQGALNVVADPCLRDVAGMLYRLHELEQTPIVPGAPPPPPVQATLGIGLCKAVKPLRAIIFLRENPWIAIAGGVGILGGLVGIGYRMGKRRGAKAT